MVAHCFIVHSLDGDNTIWFSHFFENLYHQQSPQQQHAFAAESSSMGEKDDSDENLSTLNTTTTTATTTFSNLLSSISQSTTMATTITSGGRKGKPRHPFKTRAQMIATQVTNDLRERQKFEPRGNANFNLEGSFCINDLNIASETKVVLWKQYQSIAYTLVVSLNCNRVLAKHVLNQIILASIEKFKQSSSSSSNSNTNNNNNYRISSLSMDFAKEFLLKPEEFFSILQVYIPNGVLIFGSNPLMRQMIKEAEMPQTIK